MKKVFSVLFSLVMLMSLLSAGVAVCAATPEAQVIVVSAGETIQIKFSEDNCYGVSGAIEYSNRNLFSSVTPGGTSSYGKITDTAFILSSADKVTCEVVLTVKISEDARVGDTCVVSFADCESVEDNEDFTGRSGYTKTVTVRVVREAPTTTTEPSSSTEPTTTTKPSTTTEPTTTTKPSTTTQPSTTTKPNTTVKPGTTDKPTGNTPTADNGTLTTTGGEETLAAAPTSSKKPPKTSSDKNTDKTTSDDTPIGKTSVLVGAGLALIGVFAAVAAVLIRKKQ